MNQNLWWTGKDSNLRNSQGVTDLQSVGFNHSPTCPKRRKLPPTAKTASRRDPNENFVETCVRKIPAARPAPRRRRKQQYNISSAQVHCIARGARPAHGACKNVRPKLLPARPAASAPALSRRAASCLQYETASVISLRVSSNVPAAATHPGRSSTWAL
jgi:hypothetical protein